MNTFPTGVAEQIGFYVYLYIDPRDGKVFYVGQGKGNRAFQHLRGQGESRKNQRIADIIASGKQPVIEVLIHNLLDKQTALRVEAAVIDVFGIENLTGEVRGHGSELYGRRSVAEIAAQYAAEQVDVTEPALLIRINQNFRPGMSEQELYEYTRGIWVLGPRCQGVRYALAVYQGIVREVYRVDSWHEAGTTRYFYRSRKNMEDETRREFLGVVAEPEVRDKYLLKSVAHYFTRGMARPTYFVNC